MVLVVAKLRQEDEIPFDPCMSDFGSGDMETNKSRKGWRREWVKFECVALKHGRFPFPLTSSEAGVSDLTVAEGAGLYGAS